MSADPLKSPTIALVGSPNCGKTTLFNWLTGLRAKAVNYAGSTVDCHRGRTLPVYGDGATVIDTPGVYSLQPHGSDEEVTRRALMGGANVGADVGVVIVVVDGTQLNRQLYLVRQVQELKRPMVVAVTMMDIVKENGRSVNLDRLSALIGAPVVPIDGRLGGGVKELLRVARASAAESSGGDCSQTFPSDFLNWDSDRIEREIAVAEKWTAEVVTKTPARESLEHLRRWDGLFLHPVLGVVAFVVIMGALFSSIFWLAAPLMDLVDQGFSWLADAVKGGLGEGLLSDFVANGLVAGFGAVMIFVPQIFILFAGLILLEDSGYLARAATIVDRPLQKMGLSGRAFVPILSGFACAVPAVMATRNIRSTRERWITVFILPLMTCSARLPVYALLLTFIFSAGEAWKAGLALTGLYAGGLILGGVAAGVLNKILKVAPDSHFLMELPFYRRPQLGVVVKQAWQRTVSYVVKAGPTIFTFVLVLWLGTHIPYRGDAAPAEQLRESLVGRVGQVVEPVFEPMGLDWRAGLGMISAFVAREVFVSSLAVIFSIADEEGGGESSGAETSSGADSGGGEATLQATLIGKMRAATFGDEAGGRPVFTFASVMGLLVYFMIALQCLSTTGVTWREMGSWRFAIGQLVALNVVAYAAAVAVVQGLRSLGVG